jgi:hypothetical protein
VTSDKAYIQQLLSLYFCWEYPLSASLDKESFSQSRKQLTAHSSFVNALLAVGCRFSTKSSGQAGVDRSRTASGPVLLRGQESVEAGSGRHVLCTVQALGLTSIREATCGHTSESVYYSGQSIRLAIEMGLYMERESMVVRLQKQTRLYGGDLLRGPSLWISKSEN